MVFIINYGVVTSQGHDIKFPLDIEIKSLGNYLVLQRSNYCI